MGWPSGSKGAELRRASRARGVRGTALQHALLLAATSPLADWLVSGAAAVRGLAPELLAVAGSTNTEHPEPQVGDGALAQ